MNALAMRAGVAAAVAIVAVAVADFFQEFFDDNFPLAWKTAAAKRSAVSSWHLGTASWHIFSSGPT